MLRRYHSNGQTGHWGEFAKSRERERERKRERETSFE